jgi:hypothetical protein
VKSGLLFIKKNELFNRFSSGAAVEKLLLFLGTNRRTRKRFSYVTSTFSLYSYRPFAHAG